MMLDMGRPPQLLPNLSTDSAPTLDLEGDGETPGEEPAIASPAFEVKDHTSAAWVVRKVVEARAYAERVRAWAAAELRRAEQEESWFLHRFGGQLEGWLRTELTRQGGRRRCIALPSGTIGLRQQPPRLEVIDELAAVAWCHRHLPQALRIGVEADGAAGIELAAWHAQHEDDARCRHHLLREPLNHHVAETGELPEGTTLRPAQDLFYVK